jgi:serine/threonine-protein kinase
LQSPPKFAVFPQPARGVLIEGQLPSVVAHSFGTYILGHALLKYPYLRFNKVILCDSILLGDFPWGSIIDRGQVQAVRNEYGVRDIWAEHVGWFIEDSGPSGEVGFRAEHERLQQEEFRYSHSKYFEAGHMKQYCLLFLDIDLTVIALSEAKVPLPRRTYPVGLYLLYTVLSLGLLATIWFATRS